MRAGRRFLIRASAFCAAILCTCALSRAEDSDKSGKFQATPEETRAVANEMFEVADFYRAQSELFEKDSNRWVHFSYQRSQRELAALQQELFAKREAELRLQRASTIKLFEDFVQRYPEDGDYTPEALFRLADLYYDQAVDEYQLAEEKRMNSQADENAPYNENALETEDFTPTLNALSRLIERWPEFPQMDGVHYLSGFCELRMNHEKEAQEHFKHLIAAFPESVYVAESWMRLGDFYFDDHRMKEAIDAYQHVISYENSNLYPSALYKLAWSYYLDDQYVEAIAGFYTLLDYGEENGPESIAVVREEAVQYLAIAVQEDDWNGDGLPDAEAGLGRVKKYISGEKPYEVDVLKQLVDIYYKSGKYESTIETVEFLRGKYPNDSRNPEFHQRKFDALTRLQRYDEVIAEREHLDDFYGPNTAWFQENKKDEELIASTAKLLEDSLGEAAMHFHRMAQEFTTSDEATEAETIAAFERAAGDYKKFLERYPDSDQTYDFLMNYAECLYYAFHFAEAAEQYTLVRDHEKGTRYQETAAFSLILSHEALCRERIEHGDFARKPTFFDESWNAPVPETDADGEPLAIQFQQEPIPDEVRNLLTARQSYVESGFKSTEDFSRTPKIIFKIGEVYLEYGDLDNARKWFERLIRSYPQEPVAQVAGNIGFETYRLAKNWQGMSEWADIMGTVGLGDEQLQGEILTLKTGALFNEASALFEAKKYDEAAAEYLRLLEENPDTKYADAALHNAGVSYEITRRFESASRMFRRVIKEHPNSPLAERALYRLALNAERFYDYPQAIQSYLDFVSRYPEAKERADALYKAAELQEFNQEYEASSLNFERYADLFPDREDTARTYYRSAEGHRKSGNLKEELRVYETFLKRYSHDVRSDYSHQVLIVEALSRMYKLQRQLGRVSAASATRQKVIEEFARRGLQTGTVEAQYPAEARFEQVEIELADFSKIQLSGSVDAQGRAIQKLQKRTPELRLKYQEITKYRSDHWSLAALFRMASLFQHFADSLYEAPIPASFTVEQEDYYRSTLEDLALPLEDEAVRGYEQVLQAAQHLKVADEWTARAQTALNKYKPSEYPLFKPDHPQATPLILTPSRLLNVPAEVLAESEAAAANEPQETEVSQPEAGEVLDFSNELIEVPKSPESSNAEKSETTANEGGEK